MTLYNMFASNSLIFQISTSLVIDAIQPALVNNVLFDAVSIGPGNPAGSH